MSSSASQASKPTPCRTTVTVKVVVPGFHHWPTPLPAVAYLGDNHRHLFHVRVTWEVRHDDRDVEFHLAQGLVYAALEEEWGHAPHQFGGSSCEAIASTLGRRLPGRVVAVECYEDDENGARVEFA